MDWDDLRYVLAISRTAGLSPAARQLGVNPSSVYRRLEALEKELEVRLFERLRSGYRLTESGEALAEAAARMETEALSVERHVKGTDVRLQGHLRVSTSEALAMYLLPSHLAEFRAMYPEVSLDVSATNQLVDLTRRDADVAIRATAIPPDHLVGRSVGKVGVAAYASKAYLDAQGRGRPVIEYDWIGYDGQLSHIRQARWTNQHIPPERQKLRFDSIAAVVTSVAHGVGCGSMPCFAGDLDPRLERLPGTLLETDVQIWLLTHPDLRRSARVRACLQFFGTRLAAESARLLGQRASDVPAAA
ncbi:MAG: putative HTH-type transcriptional regulator [Panacagrimonas sp.]|jgi:DNA-binding transcriptional LysR family regulator|nr:LysR family transcriptional regulator [Panacagrimonas sp.]MCC2657966.1 putative HTH-type transcriptional regulator [Panacagrimonas sp.]